MSRWLAAGGVALAQAAALSRIGERPCYRRRLDDRIALAPGPAMHAALTPSDLALAALAAVAAGAVNALAGGGTLITFPTLTALGLPAIPANVTNTLAVAPGALGGLAAQRRELAGQGPRLLRLLPAAFLGGLAGGWLVLHTSEATFRRLVPWLILGASALLAVQEPLRRWLVARLAGPVPAMAPPAGEGHGSGAGAAAPAGRGAEALAVAAVLVASVYGGYFGAGLGVIVLAALGLVLHDSLTRLNATKQAVGFAANLSAALLFAVGGPVHWTAAAVMAVGAVIGGALGGRVASRVPAATLRRAVVAIGLAVGLVYLVRG